MNKLLPILLIVVLGGCSSHKLTEPNRYVNPTLDACMNLDCPSAKTLCKNISDDECRMVIRRHNMKVLSDYKAYSVKPRRSYSGYSSSSPYISYGSQSNNTDERKNRIKEYGKILDDAQNRARIREILKYAPKEDNTYRGDFYDTLPDSDPDASGGGDVW